MPITYGWTDDSHVILEISVVAPWTWDDFHTMMREVNPQIIAVGGPCATVIDVSAIGKVPPGNMMANLHHVENSMPTNVFMSVVVGASYVVTVFMNVLMVVRPSARRRARFAHTMAEARASIMEVYRQQFPDQSV